MVEKTENYIKKELEKSNLSLAFDKRSGLNLDLNIDQLLALNDIMCDLANQEFLKGLNKGYEIANKYN